MSKHPIVAVLGILLESFLVEDIIVPCSEILVNYILRECLRTERVYLLAICKGRRHRKVITRHQSTCTHLLLRVLIEERTLCLTLANLLSLEGVVDVLSVVGYIAEHFAERILLL